jgi:hypothetical protein
MSDPITPAPDSESVPDLERGGPSTIPREPAPTSAARAFRNTANPRSSHPDAGRPLTLQQFHAAMEWTGAVARSKPSSILRRKVYLHGSGFARQVHREQSRAMRRYNVMNWVLNGLLLTQAAVSAVLVALGSTGNIYRVQVAVPGGLNGVITGALSILKGQGLPGRYWQYASGLRSLGAKIEAVERRVQTGGVVTQEDVDQLSQMFEDIQHQYDMSNPDVWKNTELVHQFKSEAEQRAPQSARAVEIARAAESAKAAETVEATV